MNNTEYTKPKIMKEISTETEFISKKASKNCIYLQLLKN